MAEVRLTPSLPTVSAPTPARTSEAVRAAQRAFFNVALEGASTPAVQRSAPVAAAPSTPPQPAAQRLQPVSDPGAAPSRPLRPGSLLDIRV